MRKFIERITESMKGFKIRHEKTIFTTVARMLAFACMVVAAIYAIRLAGQISF